jgi:hypothetical protein
MYVRWKRHLMSARTADYSWRKLHERPPYSISAVLVRSKRVDGKPRQEFVCHLATISEDHISMSIHRHYFWQKATSQLDALELDQAQRGKLERKLLEVVPRPDEAEVAATRAGLEAIANRL